MAKQEQKKSKTFREAVEAIPEICTSYRSGLHALRRADACKVTASDTRKIDGSVDIDDAVKSLYPVENRWDYAIGYDSKVCFVEVHPAYTSEIDTMLKKLTWLKGWLKDKASELSILTKMTPAYIWIQSGKSAILPTSQQSKKLAQIGLPKSSLKLG